MNRAPLLAAVVVLFLPCAIALAQVQASVRMETDGSEIVVGQPFRLRIQVDAAGSPIEDVSLPDLDDFETVSRSTSQPTQLGFGTRGRPTIQTSLIHELVLIPRHAGVVHLRPVRARVGRETFTSEPLVLKIGEGSAPTTADPQTATQAGPGSLIVDARFDPTAFVAVAVDRREAYVGQQVTITYYHYQSFNGPSAVTHNPNADGFWVHDLMTPALQQESSIEVVRGVRFQVSVVARFAAFPLRPGTLAVDPIEVLSRQGFGGFGFGGDVVRTSPRITIEARPLPEPRQSGVVVGRVELEASLDPERLRTGEASTLTVRLRGEGNLRDASIAIPPIAGVRVDAPQIEDHIDAPRDLVGGERVFRFLLVPEEPGDHAIPAIRVPVFDPAAATYRDATTAALVLHATGPSVAPAATPDEPEERDEDEVESTVTFGPLRRESAFRRGTAPIAASPVFPIAVGLPPLLFVVSALVAFVRRRRAEGPTTPSARARKRGTKRRLDEAKALASRGESREFYAAVARALVDALEARLGRPVLGFTHAELRTHLLARGMDPDLAGRLVDELDGTDFARFSSVGGSTEEMSRCLERTEALVERLDRFTPTPDEEAP
ncbi:MAG: BatD family protein [Polyangiales bacterium]